MDDQERNGVQALMIIAILSIVVSFALSICNMLFGQQSATVQLIPLAKEARQEIVKARLGKKDLTLVEQHCAHCHMKPKTDGDFDVTGTLTSFQRFSMIRRLTNPKRDGRAPTDNPTLPYETRLAIIAEIAEQGEMEAKE